MYSTVGAPGIRPLRTPARPEFFHRFEAEFEARLVAATPEGLRFEAPFDGRVIRGAFAGQRAQGVHQMLLRPDGVVVLDMMKTISAADHQVEEHARGYAIPPTDLELPQETLLRPDFAWPEATFAIVGSATFRASGELGEQLNRTVAVVEGWCNFATGGLVVETRLLPVNHHVAGPISRAGARQYTVDQAVTGSLRDRAAPDGDGSGSTLLAPAVSITARPVDLRSDRAVA